MLLHFKGNKYNIKPLTIMDQNSNKNIGLGLGICYLKSEGNPRLDFGFFSLPYHTDFCLKRDTKILDPSSHKARLQN